MINQEIGVVCYVIYFCFLMQLVSVHVHVMNHMDQLLKKMKLCRLDLYLPENSDGLKPVVAFVTGGAWIIG